MVRQILHVPSYLDDTSFQHLVGRHIVRRVYHFLKTLKLKIVTDCFKVYREPMFALSPKFLELRSVENGRNTLYCPKTTQFSRDYRLTTAATKFSAALAARG